MGLHVKLHVVPFHDDSGMGLSVASSQGKSRRITCTALEMQAGRSVRELNGTSWQTTILCTTLQVLIAWFTN